MQLISEITSERYRARFERSTLGSAALGGVESDCGAEYESECFRELAAECESEALERLGELAKLEAAFYAERAQAKQSAAPESEGE